MKNKCLICNGDVNIAFSALAIKKHPFDAYTCANCGVLKVKDPYWLEEAYSSAIADCDTGLVARNIYLAKKIKPLLFYLYGRNARYLDYAGGTGLLVRLMRDSGYDFEWTDLYCENIHAKGFESKDLCKYSAVTAFEVFEHLFDPIEFLSDLFKKTNTKLLIFTTETFEGRPAKPNEWWYYAFDAGQHITFYQSNTLILMAEKLGFEYFRIGKLHFFCDKKTKKALTLYKLIPIIRIISSLLQRVLMKSKTFGDHLRMLNPFSGVD
ncbi:Methyltransferase domain containing protein [Methylophilaceae bacterium]